MLRSPFAVIGVSASLSSPPPQSCVLQPGPWRVKEIWEWDQIDGACVREWSVWRCTNGGICVCFHACGQCFGCWLSIKCQIWNAVSQEVTKCLCVLCWHIRCMASPLSSTLTDAACDSSPQQIKRLQCWVGVYNNPNASKTTFTHGQLRTSEWWWTISALFNISSWYVWTTSDDDHRV